MPTPDSNYPGAVDDYSALMAADVQPNLVNRSLHMRKALGGVTAIETTLGVDPQGGSADVVTRLAAMDAATAAAAAAAAGKVDKAGDLMTGDLRLPNIGVARTAAPQAAIHVGTFGTSGIVDPLAVILGRPDGSENIGSRAVLTGFNNKAQGTNAFVSGWNCEAAAPQASAVGFSNSASGPNAKASGQNCVASGDTSSAGGDGSQAAGVDSYAHGTKAIASQDGSRVVTDSTGFETTADAPNQNKLRFQNGWKLVKGGGSDNVDGAEYALAQDTIATTDATPTVLQSLLTSPDTVALVESRVVARRTGGIAGTNGDCYVEVRQARLKNVGGTLTILQGAAFIQSDQPWSHSWVVNAGSAELQVVGAVDNDVTWHTTTKIQRLF